VVGGKKKVHSLIHKRMRLEYPKKKDHFRIPKEKETFEKEKKVGTIVCN
jgi:hypothetical protein